jgi:UDP-N-acetylbacillosamine N-acetyltransferase
MGSLSRKPDMNAPVAIWGASGHARVVADAVRCGARHVVAGFLDDSSAARRGTSFAGSMVLGGVEGLSELRSSGVDEMIVAIGDGRVRMEKARIASAAGFHLLTVVHPAATVAGDVAFGDGVFVAAGAVVCAGARLGDCVIVNTGATVDHECEIEEGAHVGPGACLGGRVRIGRRAWIGIGATVIDRIRIGAESTIGAGAVVVRDIPAGVVAYGVPARPMRGQAWMSEAGN